MQRGRQLSIPRGPEMEEQNQYLSRCFEELSTEIFYLKTQRSAAHRLQLCANTEVYFR